MSEPEEDLKIPVVDGRIDFYVPDDVPADEIAKVIGWLKLVPGCYIECDLAFEGKPVGRHRLTLERVDGRVPGNPSRNDGSEGVGDGYEQQTEGRARQAAGRGGQEKSVKSARNRIRRSEAKH